jgi:hypothetical protein
MNRADDTPGPEFTAQEGHRGSSSTPDLLWVSVPRFPGLWETVLVSDLVRKAGGLHRGETPRWGGIQREEALKR